jgi:hypothetical protein
VTAPWPRDALFDQAGRIGPALLELLARQGDWIHRRLERIEIVSSTQFTRTVAAELTVPVPFADRLELRADPTAVPPDRGAAPSPGPSRRVVIPLGSLPKGALVDFTLAPADATRLTALQTNLLLLSAIAPFARAADAPPEFLGVAQRIILSETRRDDELATAEKLLDRAGGDPRARDYLRQTVTEFNANYALLIVLDVVPGLPLRVTYGHRDYYPREPSAPSDPPLVIEAPLVHASGPGPPYRLELVAPDGFEVETASLARVAGDRRIAIEAVNTEPGAGAFVQLRAPDSDRRPAQVSLVAELGWVTGGVHHLAAAVGILSTLSLLAATVLTFVLGTALGNSSASALFAAPALVTSLVLGFATTRIASAPANRLRLASLWIALLGIAGTLCVTVLGGQAAQLDALKGLLIGTTVLSGLITGAWTLPAAVRERSRVELADAPQ